MIIVLKLAAEARLSRAADDVLKPLDISHGIAHATAHYRRAQACVRPPYLTAGHGAILRAVMLQVTSGAAVVKLRRL